MGSRQESLIYIEKDNTTEAEYMSRSFVDKEVRNRAYINALGAELGIKYLTAEGFQTQELHNLHSISKLLEKYDIADILLPNIHIDVRVVFDEKQIFIPKSHYKMEMLPDIYLILKLDKNLEFVEFLGFIEPEKINTKNANSDYYFVEKNKLTSPDKLKQYIKNFTGSTSRDISEEDLLRGRELSIALADHNIPADEEKELIELLNSSDVLRESVLEFDNFETLAYNVAKTLAERTANAEITLLPPDDDIIQNEEINVIDTVEDEDNIFEPSLDENETLEEPEILEADELITEESAQEDASIEEEMAPDIIEQGDEPKTEENLEQEDVSLEEPLIDMPDDEENISLDISESSADEVLADETEAQAEDAVAQETDIEDSVEEQQNSLPEFSDDTELSESLLDNTELDEAKPLALEDTPITDIPSEPVENLPEEPVLGFSEHVSLPEEPLMEITPDLVENADTPSEQLVDNILDKLIDGGEKPKPENKDLAQTVSDAIQNSLEKGIQAAAAAGTASIAGAAAAAGTASIAGAAAVEAAKDAAAIEAGAAATEGAIKLASVAGDLISNVVEQNVEKQQKNLDRIDYAKTDIVPDVTEIPEHIKAMGDLSIAKMAANQEAEASGAFEGPTDLNELKQVDDTHEEIIVEQETIDLNAMDSVQTEDLLTEDTDSVVNLSSINIESPTKPVNSELNTHDDAEFLNMDLPDLSSYTINEDGTSNMDNFAADINFNDSADEHLIDMKLNDIDNLSFDDSINDNFGSEQSANKAEDIFAGDKIITESLDNDPVSDFGTDDFPPQDEIINLDDTEPLNELTAEDNEFAQETEISISEPAVDDSLDEIPSQEPNNELVNQDTQSDEISLDEFAAMEDATGNDEILSGFELSDAEIPQEEVPAESAQDWVSDTNYDNLADAELPAAEPIAQEEMIVEPEAAPQKVYTARENSRVISDRNFTVGEIPIDINNYDIPKMPENENLEDLYEQNSNIAGGALLQNPGRLGTGRTSSGNPLGGIMKLAGGLIVLAVVCIIGFNVAKMFKAPTEETPQPITDDAVPTAPETTAVDNNTLDVNPDNVVTMDNTTDALANPTTLKKSQPQAQTPAAPTTKKQGAAMISISKLTWEVPDYISFNPQFKQYFQAVGKSLKLSLTSDLLLATDYAYSNELRVSVTFAKDGVFKNAQILKSSGSTQIDNIVLQTVNQTLKTLKAPNSVGNDESTTAILKIYF